MSQVICNKVKHWFMFEIIALCQLSIVQNCSECRKELSEWTGIKISLKLYEISEIVRNIANAFNFVNFYENVFKRYKVLLKLCQILQKLFKIWI